MKIADLKRTMRALFRRVEAEALLNRVEVRYNPRMRTRAGTCTYPRIRSDHTPRRFLIELNPNLLLERHPEALVPTLAHELAHVVARVRHGGRAKAHGREWEALIRGMGHSPERCHRMNVEGLERRRGKESRWVCETCRKGVTLGPVQTRRERRRRGTYVCLCGGAIKPRPANDQPSLF